MRISIYAVLASLLLLPVVPVRAQGDAGLQEKLDHQYILTKFSADKADIVTAGAVLVLQKDNLAMFPASVAAGPMNTLKNGKMNQGFGDMLSVDMANRLNRAVGAGDPPKKVLVTGQKVWLYKSTVMKDKLVLVVITDPYDDGRYMAQIKFQFPKSGTPSPDDLVKMVSEVFTVQPGEAAPAAAAPTQQALAPIAPPPPPADTPPPAPKTISLGQTKAEVAAIFGPPTKVVQLGKKEIVYYPDMKVTFVDGKVSDVQ